MSESFYSISIPEPSYTDMEQLAQILSPAGVISAWWRRAQRQVVLELNDKWYIQPDGLVTESLGNLLGVPDYQIVCRGLFFFETPGHGKAVDNETALAFYNCDWSDYASDRISIQFDLEINSNLTSFNHQIDYAYDEIYSETWGIDNTARSMGEEDYSDMPALMPVDSSVQDCGNCTLRNDIQEPNCLGCGTVIGEDYSDMPALIPLYTPNANTIESSSTHSYFTRSQARQQQRNRMR
jgi:hypothetical protein